MSKLRKGLSKPQVQEAIRKSKLSIARTQRDLSEAANELQNAEAEYEELKEQLDVKQKFLQALKRKLKNLNTSN